jgi:hypothetical protein
MRLSWEHCCDLASRHELKHAGLWLKLRTPDASGTWAWGEWSQQIALPEAVFAYLAEAAVPQAPTLREITSADGSRVAVLDVMLEVPAVSVSPLEQERRVLGWDWGVRSLITVSVLEMSEGDEPSRQVSRPVFLDSGGLDGRQARLRREIDRLPPDLWGKPLRAQIPGARARRARPLSQLAQQHDGARRAVAGAALQVPSVGHPRPPGGATWHDAHLPPVPSASQNVCVLSSRRPHQGHRLGRLAVLLEPGLWLEWRERLCCEPQHCLVRAGLFNDLSPNQAVRLVLPDGWCLIRQTRLV